MKKTLMLGVAMLLASQFAFSATTCPDVGAGGNPLTLDRFLAGGDLVGGCVNQDKLYDQINYMGDVDPTQVQVNFSYVTAGTTDLHTALFQGAGWTSPFTIGYTISVIDPAMALRQVDLDFTTRSGGSPVVTQTNSPAGSLNPMIATKANRPATAYFDNVSSVMVSINGDPGKGGFIGQVVDTWTQAAVPEPTTYALMGAGLLGLGLLRRRA